MCGKCLNQRFQKSEQFPGEVAMLKSLRNWTCTTHFKKEICFGSAKEEARGENRFRESVGTSTVNKEAVDPFSFK